MLLHLLCGLMSYCYPLAPPSSLNFLRADDLEVFLCSLTFFIG